MLEKRNTVIECRGHFSWFLALRFHDPFARCETLEGAWGRPCVGQKSKEGNRNPDACKTVNGSALRIASARGPGIPRIRGCHPTQLWTQVCIVDAVTSLRPV